ncbi:MAG: STY4851/ECs_5259 family protein, partial [Candidatus Thiodiazotropha sp.]
MSDAGIFLYRLFNRWQLPQSTPDSRWLYAYEIDDVEFNQLEEILRRAYAVNGTDWNREVGAAFFLYAAEWWRRYYDGHRWSWQPILHSLGIHRDDWSSSTVRCLVEDGLRYWRLNLNRTRGLRYIGVVARQGGLPVSILSNASSHIGQILGRVLKLSTPGTSRQTLYSWIKSLKDRLPASYQDDHTLELLTDLAEGVLRIVHQAGLTSSDDAIAHLDATLP